MQSAHSLRQRASAHGLDTLADSETPDLFLSRSGVSEMAGPLLNRFGNLSAVLAADVRDLAPVVGDEAAVDLKLLHSATCRVVKGSIRTRDVISSSSALLDYLTVNMAHRGREQFRVLFLDKKNALIADEVMNEGTVDHAPVYPREVMRRALELNASAIILAHNHPSGDPTPSGADVSMTGEIVAAGRALSIAVHDHIVVGANGTASLKALGLM